MAYQELMRAPGHVTSLASSLYQLQQQGYLCDCTIQTRQANLNVHQVVLLASGSPYFRKQLCRVAKDGQTSGLLSSVLLEDQDLFVVQAVVQFVYTGEMYITPCNVEEVLGVCSLLRLDEAVKLCHVFRQTHRYNINRETVNGAAQSGSHSSVLNTDSSSQLHQQFRLGNIAIHRNILSSQDSVTYINMERPNRSPSGGGIEGSVSVEKVDVNHCRSDEDQADIADVQTKRFCEDECGRQDSKLSAPLLRSTPAAALAQTCDLESQHKSTTLGSQTARVSPTKSCNVKTIRKPLRGGNDLNDTKIKGKGERMNKKRKTVDGNVNDSKEGKQTKRSRLTPKAKVIDSDNLENMCRSSGVTNNTTKTGVTNNTTKTGVTDNTTKTSVTDNTTKTGVTDNTTKKGVTDNTTKTGVTDNTSKTSGTDNTTKTGGTDNTTMTGVTGNTTKTSGTDNTTMTGVTYNTTKTGVTYNTTKTGVTDNMTMTGVTDNKTMTGENSTLHQTANPTLCNSDTNSYEKHKRSFVLNFCRFCTIRFTDKEKFQEHKKQFHLFSCDVCGWSSNRGLNLASHQYNQHGIHHKPDKYPLHRCDQAGCEFKSIIKHNITVHKKIHSQERQFRCDLCDASFKYKSQFNCHRKTHDPDNLPFKCESCEKAFPRNSLLSAHTKNVHHRDELCHLCPWKSSSRRELHIHLLRVHNIPLPNNFKIFQCDVCDYYTFTSIGYRSHMDLHIGKKYQCKECGKFLGTEMRLYVHERKHKTDVKLTSCSYPDCNYKTMSKATLKIHQDAKHSEYKPFLCHICDFRCKVKGNLDKHLRGRHNMEVMTITKLWNRVMTTGQGYSSIVQRLKSFKSKGAIGMANEGDAETEIDQNIMDGKERSGEFTGPDADVQEGAYTQTDTFVDDVSYTQIKGCLTEEAYTELPLGERDCTQMVTPAGEDHGNLQQGSHPTTDNDIMYSNIDISLGTNGSDLVGTEKGFYVGAGGIS